MNNRRKSIRVLHKEKVAVISELENERKTTAAKTVPSMPYYNPNQDNVSSTALDGQFKTVEEIENYVDILDDESNQPWIFVDELGEDNREMALLLGEIFPEIIDDYIMVKHLKARGYQVRIDGSELEVEGELIENFDPRGADFYFSTSNPDKDPKADVESLDHLMEDIQLNKYERTSKVPVIAVVSNSGKVYGLRLHHVDLKKGGKNPFNLYRMRRSPKYQNELNQVNRALSVKDKPPKFSDKELNVERGSNRLPR